MPDAPFLCIFCGTSVSANFYHHDTACRLAIHNLQTLIMMSQSSLIMQMSFISIIQTLKAIASPVDHKSIAHLPLDYVPPEACAIAFETTAASRLSRMGCQTIVQSTFQTALIFWAAASSSLQKCLILPAHPDNLYGDFLASYNDPPAHYKALQRRIEANDDFGRANIDNQKIFIAASIYDKGGHLVDGEWGRRVIQLLNLLGNRNAFLSVYENDGDSDARDALERFKEKVECNKEFVFEEHLPLEYLPNITLQDGSKRIKRIAYLAEVRNQALEPLNDDPDVVFDKILFLNDIIFDPVDAVQLLFSTNMDETGKASYDAACAVDFINPFKFYDTFATRDIEGYSMGVPFFPWYSNAGMGRSRQDVLDGKDAVRVKSCWSGMVAFDAKFFMHTQPSGNGKDLTDHIQELSEPLRFRALPDRDWDASECCLIHADLLGSSSRLTPWNDRGIYQNPYVRVAYDSWTLWWIPITRRWERCIAYRIISSIILSACPGTMNVVSRLLRKAKLVRGSILRMQST